MTTLPDQRREIGAGGTIRHVNQAVVNAAIHGRVLVLEGLEKVERNVLPVLNNLLENREMQLEDGSFLVAPDRFDRLLETHDRAHLTETLRLIRVHDGFRVIALGVPVPPFPGNPLDPPLRSRFQARHVDRVRVLQDSCVSHTAHAFGLCGFLLLSHLSVYSYGYPPSFARSLWTSICFVELTVLNTYSILF